MAYSGLDGGVTESDVQEIINTNTGWAQYKDTSLTSIAPQLVLEGITATLTNNALSTIVSNLPIGGGALYDAATSKITPYSSGDAYMLRVDFKAFTSSQSGLLSLKLDIGGAQGVIFDRDITFPKGTGLSNVRSVSTSSLIYTLDTFVANGGAIQVESIVGNTSIYDVTYVISRIHKG